jgi:ATP-binding cassette, subfamily B, bacterial
VTGDRTTITIAHRMATAETADRVLVFHSGRIVEQGHHHDLVAQGGVYAGLHRAWTAMKADTVSAAVEAEDRAGGGASRRGR